MKARELQLSLEVGITGVFATGSDAYQDGWHDWQRYLALGAPLTALFIDEPITNGSRLSGLSYSTIVQETVNRIVLVRRNPALEYMKVVQRWMPAPHRKLRHFHPRAPGGCHGAKWNNGKLWIASTRLGAILRVDPTSWVPEVLIRVSSDERPRLHDVEFDNEGNIWVVTANNSTSYAEGRAGLNKYDGKPASC